MTRPAARLREAQPVGWRSTECTWALRGGAAGPGCGKLPFGVEDGQRGPRPDIDATDLAKSQLRSVRRLQALISWVGGDVVRRDELDDALSATSRRSLLTALPSPPWRAVSSCSR